MSSTSPPWTVRANRGILVSFAAALLMKDLRLSEAVSFGSERTLLLIAVLLAGIVLCALGLRLLVWAAFTILLITWLAVAFTPLDRALAEGLPRADPLAPADAIYVLASDIQPDGDLSSEASARLLHGLELVGQDLAPRLIVGELAAPRGRYADAARGLLGNLGLVTELLSIGPVATTHDEALLLGELFRKNGWRRVLMVTGPLHSRRAAAVFENQGLEVVSSPTREAKYDLDQLDSPEERLRAFPEILHEWLGSWVYRRRGWIH